MGLARVQWDKEVDYLESSHESHETSSTLDFPSNNSLVPSTFFSRLVFETAKKVLLHSLAKLYCKRIHCNKTFGKILLLVSARKAPSQPQKYTPKMLKPPRRKLLIRCGSSSHAPTATVSICRLLTTSLGPKITGAKALLTVGTISLVLVVCCSCLTRHLNNTHSGLE